jgi:hypothetical protein
MGEQFASELGGGPGATPSARPPDTATGGVTQSKVDAFDESRVERAGKPEHLEALGEVREVAPSHAAFDPSFHSGQALSESAAAIGFLDLTIEQVVGDLPAECARSHIGDPLTEMGGDRIEVEVEAIAGEAGFAHVARDERGMWASTDGTIVGSAWLEGP